MPSDTPQIPEIMAVTEPGRWVARPVAPAPEPESGSTTFSHYVWLLWRQGWKIALFAAAVTALAYFASKRIAPVYESTATVDIDRHSPNGVIGQAAQQPSPGDAEQFIATQVRLIQSASVLRPVAEQFHLGNGDPQQAKGAVSIPGLRVAHVPGTYIILITYRSGDPTTAAAVANGVAESYIKHDYDLRVSSTNGLSKYMASQIDELKAKMERSDAAVADYSRELNFIAPEEKTNVLTSRLLQLNSEYISAQNDRVKREAAFNAVRAGSLEAAQTSTQGESTRKLADRLEEAQQHFAQVEKVFGKRHPKYADAQEDVVLARQALQNSTTNTLSRVTSEYREALNREQLLKRSLDETKAQVDSTTRKATEYQAKQREAESNRKLYEELMQHIKEAGVNSGFNNNSVRVADPAQPVYTPVSPNVRNNTILALLLSLFLGIGAAVLFDSMDSTVRTPDAITSLPGAEVIGLLPLVQNWSGGSSEFEEALRRVRNSVLLGGVGERPKSVLFTSAAPDEGKTTAAVHLALVHAMQGKRTLLIDADLRRPGTRQILGYGDQSGLAGVIANGLAWQDAIVRLPAHPDLDILPSGTPSPSGAALVEKVIPSILRESRSEYDLVIIDAPPMLGFSEPIQIAAVADRVVVMARVGQTNLKSVATMLKILGRVRARVAGVVLNGANRELSDRYTYHGAYAAYRKHYGERRIA